jgi:hypothetical protein
MKSTPGSHDFKSPAIDQNCVLTIDALPDSNHWSAKECYSALCDIFASQLASLVLLYIVIAMNLGSHIASGRKQFTAV